MSAVAYSNLKAAWHLDEVLALREKRRFAPPHVQLILSDLCNQDCSFCAYRMSSGFSSENFAGPDGERNPNRKIPTAKALEILDDCAALGVKAVQFTGGGEPTVHPEHMLIFEHALSLGLKCALVTNGTRLAPGFAEVFSRFDWIRVSLDAGTASTYASIRGSRPHIFEKVLDNVRTLVRTCPGVVGVGFVVTPENWREIEPGVAAAAATGAAYIRISAMFSKDFTTPFVSIYDEIKVAIAHAQSRFANATFEVIDLFGERLSDLTQHAPDYPICGYQHFNVYVGGDLKVYRCCNTAYTNLGEVGNLAEQTFRAWFETSDAAYFSFDARSCSVCQFNNKNRAINYVVEPTPLHVEFV
jgi:MoaA/NifB/PqqE/SkfB family radical SAM enzyme